MLHLTPVCQQQPMHARVCRAAQCVPTSPAFRVCQRYPHKRWPGSIVGAGPEEKVAAKPRTPAAAPNKQQEQPRQTVDSSQSPAQSILQQIQQQWNRLDTPQKGYTVVAGLVLLTLLPQVITLLVLLVERVLIGGLLAVEEVLLQLLIRGGAVLGVLALVGALVAGVYLLSSKTTK